ncbi:cyclic nucleotide phosphodiesterase inhibitor-like isoform X2 [Dendronephthya gigantea]|uniref:cyclic nucleotide phosphodiesterase inhibitor-like isoform X2 n=1 Tax=Dendronephthya gigantea TaxID=151771 RepID=UPI00106B4039|nr:cyclic nucleotide phosphodiesterase inhibitor-like isoform X2 [Dendronephthya gigantea]
MRKQLLVAFGILLTFAAVGNGLSCYQCTAYEEQEACQSSNCSSTFDRCSTTTVVDQDGTKSHERSCNHADICNTDRECRIEKAANPHLKSCDFKCCSTDDCNNPSEKVLKCNVCDRSKRGQKCKSMSCKYGRDRCGAGNIAFKNGTEWSAKYCTTAYNCKRDQRLCDKLMASNEVKSCDIKCCSTDNCNSGADGVTVAKFTLSLMTMPMVCLVSMFFLRP